MRTIFSQILLIVSVLSLCLCGVEHTAEAQDNQLPAIISPLSGEGYLWAPPMSPLPASKLSFQFAFSYHEYEYDFEGFGPSVEVTFSSIQLILSGEYTFFDALTVGLDLPFLYVHDASTSNDFVDSTAADFGNLRLHIRYMAWSSSELGLVFTPAFRVWLPTNTFLDIDTDWGNADVIESFAVFEPFLILGWGKDNFSIVFETGPKFVTVDDADDFSFWNFDLVIGSAPILSLPGLQFVLELNFMAELDDDDAFDVEYGERVQPLALSLGARYLIDPVLIELAFRVGLHEAIFYYGDFNLGLTVSYLFGG